MQFSSQSATSVQPGVSPRTRQAEDLVYQVMTIAAILLVLGSVWLF